MVSLCAYVLVSLYKLFLLVTEKGVYWFALSNAIDYCIIACALLFIYHRLETKRLRFSLDTAKQLLGRSKYYIVSGLMVVIFGQTDRIMLKLMVGNAETGCYSAAAYCAGVASFVFVAIIDSMRPVILKHKAESETAFERDVVRLFSIITYLAMAYSIAMSLFAPLVIRILYGNDYTDAVPVLRVIVWYCTASYLGGARDIWMLAENQQKHLLLINALGAAINVVLNVFLIPVWHAGGAAVASVITQYVINIGFTSLYKPTRRTGYLMLRGFDPRVITEIVRNLKKRKA